MNRHPFFPGPARAPGFPRGHSLLAHSPNKEGPRMNRLNTLAVPLALLAGAMGGYLAASGQLTSMLRARAVAPAGEAGGGTCCDCEGREQFIAAQADTKEAKKPNILVVFGDDVGQTNVSAYSM